MSYLLSSWPTNPSVKAVQTDKKLKEFNGLFNINPAKSKQQSELNRLQKTFNLPHHLYFLNQQHGDQCIELTKPLKNHFQFQADACFSREKEVICAVMSADCLPILLTDSEASFVAAVHCGWRSLYQNILTKTLQMINNDKPISAWLGPSICQNHYQVDADFVRHFLKEQPHAKNAFSPIQSSKSHADLKQLAIIQLQNEGVTDISIDSSCTYADTNYYSWRENKTKARQASIIWKSQ